MFSWLGRGVRSGVEVGRRVGRRLLEVVAVGRRRTDEFGEKVCVRRPGEGGRRFLCIPWLVEEVVC